MHQLHNDFILLIFLLKKGQTVFNNCNIRIQYLHYNLQKIKKKNLFSLWFVQEGGKTLVEK